MIGTLRFYIRGIRSEPNICCFLGQKIGPSRKSVGDLNSKPTGPGARAGAGTAVEKLTGAGSAGAGGAAEVGTNSAIIEAWFAA